MIAMESSRRRRRIAMIEEIIVNVAMLRHTGDASDRERATRALILAEQMCVELRDELFDDLYGAP